MKKETIFNLIFVALLLVLIYVSMTRKPDWNNIQNKPDDIYLVDAGRYDYCVAWGNIHRETILKDCYDYHEQKIICTWSIHPETDELTLYNYYNATELLKRNCTTYMKTIEVRR